MKVSTLLESLPGFGKAKAMKIMSELEISESRRVQGLGARQREQLMESPRLDADCCRDRPRRPSLARKGHLFIVSGPSGAGKGTLVKELLRRVPDVWVSVSVTTRAPRPGEVEGRHYYFISAAASSTSSSRLAGCSSGPRCTATATARRVLRSRQKVAAGSQVILEIDPQGAFQVRDLMPRLGARLRHAALDGGARAPAWQGGAETEEQVEVRMQTAERELALVGKYDHVVINDDVARATDELVGIIDSYADDEES